MQESNEQYRIVISGRARQMLVSCAAFLANVSESAANRLVKSFEEAAQSLKTMPFRCPWLVSEFIPRSVYRCLVFEQRYMLIYQVRGDTVYIDYVVDCRQHYGWLLK